MEMRLAMVKEVEGEAQEVDLDLLIYWILDIQGKILSGRLNI